METERDDGGLDHDAGPSAAGMLPVFILFVVVGAPLVYLIWHFINDLLLGVFDPAGAGLAAAGAVGLAGVLTLVSRQISRWEER